MMVAFNGTKTSRMATIFCAACFLTSWHWVGTRAHATDVQSPHKHRGFFNTYCLDCHDGPSAEGNLDLAELMDQSEFDATLIFENVATGKMPPAGAEQPSANERQKMLKWLAEQQPESKPKAYRRLSRYEFVQSLNDLLGTNLNLSGKIPEDRGTLTFDSDRRIGLSRDMLRSYFAVADELLDHALPRDGFVSERAWVTNKLKDSHETYNIYVRDYKEGILFSWTRANNGNSYSFFYDNFDPPAAGWYELTFDVAKVGTFKEDVSVQVHAGKYYYADDRPQPQRLLGVISVGNDEVESKTIRVFLNPGESVSVHCYSRHNFRNRNPQQGAYIKQLKARGPLQDQWPPSRYSMLFANLPVESVPQGGNHGSSAVKPVAGSLTLTESGYQTNLQKIGGSMTVSSFQPGMAKEKMQDGSNRTFWHTRFKPTLAEPPHFVVLENPNRHSITGLSYSTWSGGNGNGQIEKYEIHLSDDGENWGEPILKGELETRLANEQPILFPEATTSRFIRFLAAESFSLDGRSLASIGKLDVVVSLSEDIQKTRVSIRSGRDKDLKQVIRRFAERAFTSELTDAELEPYFEVAIDALKRNGEFVQAAKLGFKAVVCSHRFLIVPGQHSSQQLAQQAMLARVLWLSISDSEVREPKASLREQIALMLQDERSDRMIESLCNQWLNLRSWNKVTPSLKLYPRYDDLLNYYLPLETRAYIAHLIRTNRPVSHLIDSNYSFLNQRLAQHYGLDDVTGQFLRKVSFGPEVPRGGLLTMGSILKVTTDGFATSPILRGAWISKNLVGTPISPPPESVKAIEPEHGGEAASLREQIDRHKNNEACYTCHKSIDPYGFALENFDSTGQWRDKYRTEMAHRGTFQFRINGYYRLTSSVEAEGKIGGQEFVNIFGLKKVLLSDNRKIAYNFCKKFFEYVNGYEPNLKQRLALLEMIKPQDCRMQDLVTDVLVYSIGLEADQ